MRKERESFERRAVEALSTSLAPSLHGSKMWNAVAFSFFNPALSLDNAFTAAEGIDHLRRMVNASERGRKRHKKTKRV